MSDSYVGLCKALKIMDYGAMKNYSGLSAIELSHTQKDRQIDTHTHTHTHTHAQTQITFFKWN